MKKQERGGWVALCRLPFGLGCPLHGCPLGWVALWVRLPSGLGCPLGCPLGWVAPRLSCPLKWVFLSVALWGCPLKQVALSVALWGCPLIRREVWV